jgi:hypothetical protein
MKLNVLGRFSKKYSNVKFSENGNQVVQWEHTHTDRHTHRHTYRQTHTHTYTHTDTHTHRHTHTDRHTHTHTNLLDKTIIVA